MTADRPPLEVLMLADACYEMYELRELEDFGYIRRELSYKHQEMPLDQIERAIRLAIGWKRAGEQVNYSLN